LLSPAGTVSLTPTAYLTMSCLHAAEYNLPAIRASAVAAACKLPEEQAATAADALAATEAPAPTNAHQQRLLLWLDRLKEPSELNRSPQQHQERRHAEHKAMQLALQLARAGLLEQPMSMMTAVAKAALEHQLEQQLVQAQQEQPRRQKISQRRVNTKRQRKRQRDENPILGLVRGSSRQRIPSQLNRDLGAK